MQFLGVFLLFRGSSAYDIRNSTVAETNSTPLINELKCFVRQVKKGLSAEQFLITRGEFHKPSYWQIQTPQV